MLEQGAPSLEAPVTICVPGRAGVACIIEELSAGRCKFRSLAGFTTGDIVEFSLSEPKAELSLRGSVVSVTSKPPRVAHEVVLEELSEGERTRLAAIVEVLSRRRSSEQATGSPLQRSSVRVSADFPVEFHAGPSAIGQGRCANISVGGMMMRSADDAVVGATLALRFRLGAGDSQEIAVRARVVARVPAGDVFQYHLAFFNVDPASRSRIAQFVSATMEA